MSTRSCVPQGVSVEATPFDSGEPEPFGRAVLCWSGKIHQSQDGEVGFWYEREGSTAQAAALARELDARGSDATCGPHVGITFYLVEPEATRLLRIAQRRAALLEAALRELLPVAERWTLLEVEQAEDYEENNVEGAEEQRRTADAAVAAVEAARRLAWEGAK